MALTQKSSSYLGEGRAPEEEQDIAGAMGWKKEKLDAAGAERGRKHRRLASVEADRHPSPITCMSWAQLKHPLLWEAFGGPALSEEGPVLPLEPWPADLCILGSSHRLRHKVSICHGGVGRAGDCEHDWESLLVEQGERQRGCLSAVFRGSPSGWPQFFQHQFKGLFPQ